MPEHFLIVDDDHNSAFLARRNVLQVFPLATVEHAPSGPAALDALHKREFTAVVTDYRMPWMDGLTLVRKIREMGNQVPIIMCTAMDDMEAPARAAGVDHVLPWAQRSNLGEVLKETLHCHATNEDRSP